MASPSSNMLWVLLTLLAIGVLVFVVYNSELMPKNKTAKNPRKKIPKIPKKLKRHPSHKPLRPAPTQPVNIERHAEVKQKQMPHKKQVVTAPQKPVKAQPQPHQQPTNESPWDNMLTTSELLPNSANEWQKFGCDTFVPNQSDLLSRTADKNRIMNMFQLPNNRSSINRDIRGIPPVKIDTSFNKSILEGSSLVAVPDGYGEKQDTYNSRRLVIMD